MFENENSEADKIFEDLEASFKASQKRSKIYLVLYVLGLPFGLILILVGLSLHLMVSIAGYALMLFCAIKIFWRLKDLALLNIHKLDLGSKFTRSR
jgi:hypothetical protein